MPRTNEPPKDTARPRFTVSPGAWAEFVAFAQAAPGVG